MELNSKNIKKLLLIILGAAIIFASLQNLGAVWGFIGKVLSIFAPIIAALCIAFVLNVLLNFFEKRVFFFFTKSKFKFVKKLKRPVSLIFTYLLSFGIISLLILVIIPDLIETLTYLFEKMPSFVNAAMNWIEGTLANFHIKIDLPEPKINWNAAANTLKDWFSNSHVKIFGDALNITTSVFSGVFDTLFSIVISVYVLAQKERIANFMKRMINAFTNTKISSLIYHIADQTQEIFARFIGGQCLEALILGTLCFIGMTIFSMPNALIISVIITVTALVPIVGATIGVIIGFLLIVITNPLKALFFVIFVLILQQIEGNLIYPKVVGKAVGLPGILVVSAVLIGGNIGGVLGALVAVPSVAVIFVLLKELIDYLNRKKQEKITE